MLLLHHPYAVDHLSILDTTKQTNRYGQGLRNHLSIPTLLLVRVSPGHQRPAPNTDGWR